MKPIICIGFTPCVQRVITFDHLAAGGVNRALRTTTGLGGKGVNTAHVVKLLGGNPQLIGFSGGPNGVRLEQMLEDAGLAFHHVEVSGETRICQTLLETGSPDATELVEEMPPVSSEEWSRMKAFLGTLDFSGAFVTISGKLPAGLPEDAYAYVAGLVSNNGGQVILDAPGGPLLSSLQHGPFMVKMNEAELEATIGSGEVRASCNALLDQGAQSVLITDGPRSAYYVDREQEVELAPPIINAVNPIGSGDSVTAGLAYALAHGAGIEEALVTAMACGAANALTSVCGSLHSEDVERLKHDVQLSKVEL